MKRDDIVLQLANADWLKQAVKNIGGNLADDLLQEFFIVVCSKPDEEVERIYADGYLSWWCIRILVRLYHGNGKQKFYREFRKPSDSLPEHLDDISDEYTEDEYQRQLLALKHDEQFYGRVAKEHNRADWYVRILWEMYCKNRSMKQISRDSGINFREIQTIINSMKDEIRRQYDRNNP